MRNDKTESIRLFGDFSLAVVSPSYKQELLLSKDPSPSWVKSRETLEKLFEEYSSTTPSLLLSAVPFPNRIIGRWDHSQARKMIDEGYQRPQTAKTQAKIFEGIKGYLEYMKPFRKKEDRDKVLDYLTRLCAFLSSRDEYLQSYESCSGWLYVFGQRALVQQMITEGLLDSQKELSSGPDSFLRTIAVLNTF